MSFSLLCNVLLVHVQVPFVDVSLFACVFTLSMFSLSFLRYFFLCFCLLPSVSLSLFRDVHVLFFNFFLVCSLPLVLLLHMLFMCLFMFLFLFPCVLHYVFCSCSHFRVFCCCVCIFIFLSSHVDPLCSLPMSLATRSQLPVHLFSKYLSLMLVCDTQHA